MPVIGNVHPIEIKPEEAHLFSEMKLDPYAEMAELLADKLGDENLLKLWDLIESDSQDRLFDRLSDVIVRRGLAPVEDDGDVNSPEDPR